MMTSDDMPLTRKGEGAVKDHLVAVCLRGKLCEIAAGPLGTHGV